jgi:hypothetical protein
MEGYGIDSSVVNEFLDKFLDLSRGQGLRWALLNRPIQIGHPTAPFRLTKEADLTSETL